MTPKIQKITGEIAKNRTRITEQRERLRELEEQKLELENTEIVALFRSTAVSPDQLPAFIAAMKTAPLGQKFTSSTQVNPPYAPQRAGEEEQDED